MRDLEFWKMSGCGNDFILIDNRGGVVPENEMGRLVERICRRRESVGADGAIFVVASGSYDFKWRFLNSDGGEAEMCGNGARCVARFARLNGIAGDEMTFETLAGPISAHVRGRVVKVQIPRPFGHKADIELHSDAGLLKADFLNTGVPHAVVQVEGLEDFPVFEIGKWIRFHTAFAPQGANANFIRITGPDSLDIRTYERGVEDETLACGTGAIASALCAASRGLVRSPTKVKTYGGEALIIHYKEASGRFDGVWLEGSTSIIYKARLGEEAL
jgi:diaminopimelate epimerase